MREARLPRMTEKERESAAMARAIRLAPALVTLAEKRRIWQAVRRTRWIKNRDAQDLLRAPRHIYPGDGSAA